MSLRPPPINAELKLVTRYQYAGEDPYGNEIYDDVPVFEGSAPAYQTEKVENIPASGGGAILMRTATVAIPATLTDPVTGDVVTVQTADKITVARNGVEQPYEIDALEDRRDAGFVRVFLRDSA